MEIIAQMLSLAREETKKTRLMYQTNLCYNQLVHYIDFLVDKGFLDIKNGTKGNRYCISDKGKEFLENVEKVISQVK
jgi:predicted transcriptional regulator